MKTAIIILLLVAATAQNLSAKDRRAELYLYGRVSTALRVESSDLKDWFGDWSFGGDAGLGIWYGTFHAGVSGVITTSALRLIGWVLLEGIFEQVDPSIEEIIANYIDVPLGEWEKIPRLQAKTLVSLRYHGELPQDVA